MARLFVLRRQYPRTLLMLSTWASAKLRDALFVHLFVGSCVQVGELAGTRVEMVQATAYPWKGAVAITVNPETAARFALHVRVPSRATSTRYTAKPALGGLRRMTVNGEAVTPLIDNGYAVIIRTWQPGDRIAFEVPTEVQRITASISSPLPVGRWRFATGRSFIPLSELSSRLSMARWRDGTPLRTVPYYARMNPRGTEPRLFPLSDGAVDTPKNADMMAQAMRSSRVWIQT